MSEGDILRACEPSIRSPSARMFEILSDFEQYLVRLGNGPITAEKLTPGPIAAGTRFRVTAKVAGSSLIA